MALHTSHFNAACACLSAARRIIIICGASTAFPLIIQHHVWRRRKSASYYLVYLDIWLLLFRTVPALILLITLTNTASPVWHKSKQNTVVAPSLGPNLNISAGVKSGTENPYGVCGQSLLLLRTHQVVFQSCAIQSSTQKRLNVTDNGN